MNNRRLIIVTLLLSISILGLMVLQLYLLGQSFESQEKTFDQNVNHALRSLSDNLEKNEFVALMNIVENKKSLQGKLIQIQNLKDSLSHSNNNIKYNFKFKSDSLLPGFLRRDSFKIEIDSDETVMKISSRSKKKWSSALEKKEKELKKEKEEISNRIFFSEDQDVAIHAFKFDSVEIEKIYSNSINDSSRTTIIRKKAAYDVLFNPILRNHQLNLNDIDSILNHILLDIGIDIPYRLALNEKNKITGTSRISYLYKNEEKDKSSFASSPYFLTLYSQDQLLFDNELKLYFPSKNSFIWYTIMPSIVLSLFFIGIVISIFIMIIRNMMQQKKLSDMKNDFINNMTHELKTPISTIALASEGIQNKSTNISQKVKQYAHIIYEENRRLSKQVEKILQLSQLEKEQLHLDRVSFDIHDVIKEVIANYDIRLLESKSVIHLELNANFSFIYADKLHIQNVINNLIDNAIKYCKKEPEITIKSSNLDQKLILIFEDNGIGISNDDLENVFEKFYRVHTGDIHDVKGYGLGLTYVKNILDSHHFMVNIASKVSKGTKITITFDIFDDEKEIKDAD